MTRSLSAALAACLLAAAPAWAARFTVQGLSPSAAGQTVEEAGRRLGSPLLVEPRPGSAASAASSVAGASHTASNTSATAAASPAKAASTAVAPKVAASATSTAASATAAATPACHYRQARTLPGVRFTIVRDHVVRAETRDARYASASGLHVGDTLAKAQKLYGKRLVEQPHAYFAHGKMLLVYAGDRKAALVMESNDQGRIITLRGGRLPEVATLEGCATP